MLEGPVVSIGKARMHLLLDFVQDLQVLCCRNGASVKVEPGLASGRYACPHLNTGGMFAQLNGWNLGGVAGPNSVVLWIGGCKQVEVLICYRRVHPVVAFKLLGELETFFFLGFVDEGLLLAAVRIQFAILEFYSQSSSKL